MSQLVLPMNDRDRDVVAGARVRAACKVVATDLTHKVVAELWGCHESTVGLKLDEANRNYIKPHEMIALKRADLNNLIEAAEQLALRPPETDADIVRRIPGALRKYLSPEFAELIEREMGLRG